MSIGPPAATDPLKLWILTSVAECKRSLCVLGSRDPGLSLNMHFPLVPRSDLVEALLQLIDEKVIFVIQRGRRRGPNLQVLNQWLNDPKDWRPGAAIYGLTRAGGLQWERASRANWSRFIENYIVRWKFTKDGDLGEQTVVFEGGSEQRLRLYSFAYAGGSHSLVRAHLRRLSPWKATYWKTLPNGYRLTCDFVRRDYNPLMSSTTYPLRDLGKWYETPPLVYSRLGRPPVLPCLRRNPY